MKLELSLNLKERQCILKPKSTRYKKNKNDLIINIIFINIIIYFYFNIKLRIKRRPVCCGIKNPFQTTINIQSKKTTVLLFNVWSISYYFKLLKLIFIRYISVRAIWLIVFSSNHLL